MWASRNIGSVAIGSALRAVAASHVVKTAHGCIGRRDEGEARKREQNAPDEQLTHSDPR
jgi:hypothetical protein